MLKALTANRENLPGIALVEVVVVATVWLVMYRLGVDDTGVKVVVAGLTALVTSILYSDHIANGLDSLLYGPNYNPKVLTAESQRTKGHLRYLLLPNWKRMHEKRTAFGKGLHPPISEDGTDFLTHAREMLTPEDRKAVDSWLKISKALRSIVPFLAVTSAIELAVAFAWQPREKRPIDLLIAAGSLILMLAATHRYLGWRVRYLEELYERAHRANRLRPQAQHP
jgi:hypothetical protein